MSQNVNRGVSLLIDDLFEVWMGLGGAQHQCSDGLIHEENLISCRVLCKNNSLCQAVKNNFLGLE
jgi:hypothetical protein